VNGGPSLGGNAVVRLDHEEFVRIRLPGGGGFGDPFEREPALVLEDVRRGLLTAARARDDYGVGLKAGADAVDGDETARLRAKPRS